jgi:hypothetical protein
MGNGISINVFIGFLENLKGGVIMARIKVHDLQRDAKLSKEDQRRVRGAGFYFLQPTRPSIEYRLPIPRPNFNPYAESNAVAGIRG